MQFSQRFFNALRAAVGGMNAKQLCACLEEHENRLASLERRVAAVEEAQRQARPLAPPSAGQSRPANPE